MVRFRALPTAIRRIAPTGAMLVGFSPEPYIRNTHYPAGGTGGGSKWGLLEPLDLAPFGGREKSPPPRHAARSFARRLIRPLANSPSTISTGHPLIL